MNMDKNIVKDIKFLIKNIKNNQKKILYDLDIFIKDKNNIKNNLMFNGKGI